MSSVTVETLAENASGNVANVINVLAKAIVDRTNIGVGLEIIECHEYDETPPHSFTDVNGIIYQRIYKDTGIYNDTFVEVLGFDTDFGSLENHQAILIPHYIKIDLGDEVNEENGKIYEVKRWSIQTNSMLERLPDDTTAFIAPYLEEAGADADDIQIEPINCLLPFEKFTLVYAPKLHFMRLGGIVKFCGNSIVDFSSLTDITVDGTVGTSSPFDVPGSDKTINTLLIGVGVTAYTAGSSADIGDSIYGNPVSPKSDNIYYIFNAGITINEVRFVQTRFTNDIAYYRYNKKYDIDPQYAIAGGEYINISGAQKPLLGFSNNELYNDSREEYYSDDNIPVKTIVYYPGSLKQIDDDDGTVPFKRFAVEKTDDKNMIVPFYVYGTLRGIAIENCHRY